MKATRAAICVPKISYMISMHFKHASVPLTNAKKKLSDISSKIFAPLTSNNSFLPTRVNSKFHYPRATKLQ